MKSIPMLRTLVTTLVLATATPALGQTGATPPAAPAAAAPAPAAPAAPAAPPAPTVSLEDAYRREFAFLEAQKRELTARMAESKRRFEADRSRLEGEVASLESRVLAARAEAETASRDISVADEQQAAIDAQSELLSATFTQAEASLSGFGVDLVADAAYRDADDATRLTRLFAAASARLAESARVRTEAGSFYLEDGTEVTGTLVRIGNIATLGVSPDAAGALAPAGGGALKLWESSNSAEAARALAQGRPASSLGLYLYENVNTAAERPLEKTFGSWMQSGGSIGYVIMLLGLLGLVFALLRALFLRGASARVQKIIDGVAPALSQGRIPDAIEACKRYKGSAARVVTAALRNIDRDRAHLEDIISESILHESVHLNRFGPYILLIAAVAPLLGLLGTVTGMIQTFDVITEFGTSDPKLLSGGISVALVTTQQGLIVAIPMLLIGNVMNGWAERIKDDMEKAALKVVNLYGDSRANAAAKR
jgi:biopolymer transport protein ExbB